MLPGMPVYRLTEDIIFPDPAEAEPDGLLAVGGDLSAERLLLAYQIGVFPWFSRGHPILWWSPDPRFVLFPGKFKLSKSLAQRIRKQEFRFTFDTVFAEVIENCARVKRQHEDGTWITAGMKKAYIKLHQLGFAHSAEVWENDVLVGGLYGISLGKAFFGESMFHTKTDASKIAFYCLHEQLLAWGFHFIDCQLHTDHLASLGAEEVPRIVFLEKLEIALANETIRGLWS